MSLIGAVVCAVAVGAAPALIVDRSSRLAAQWTLVVGSVALATASIGTVLDVAR